MRVSVVMPAYNAARYIEESVRSVTAQTFADWELLIVDDCSADGTLEIVRRFASADERIHIIYNERNAGTAASRNRGIAEATGEWIAFLDSDDVWRADKLEKQLALAEKRPDAALTYTASAFMNEDGSRYGYVLEAEERTDYRTLLRKNLLTCSSVMVKRELMERYPFPIGALHEDYAVWLQMLRELPWAYGLNEPLLVYRLSKTSKSGSRIRSGRMIYASYREVGYAPATSAWFTLRYLPYSVGKRRKIKRQGEVT